METTSTTPDLEKKIAGLRRQLLVERLIIVFVLLIIFGKWTYGFFASSSCAILADGKPIVTVENKGVANELLDEALASAAGNQTEDAEFVQKIELRRNASDNPLDSESALAILKAKLVVEADKWAIVIDGKPYAAVDTKEQAGEVMELARQRYGKLAPNLLEEPSFKENVSPQLQKVDMRRWRATPQEAVELLFSPSGNKPSVHIVKKGELASTIAKKHGMKLESIVRLNPGRSIDRLQIGDQLKIGSGNPPLTVVVRDQVTRTESMPFRTESITSVSMYAGKTYIINPGRPGERQVKLAVKYENGVETGREILDEVIIRQPMPKRVAVGVKPRR